MSLTGRELEVLRLLAAGFTNLEISEILIISHHTVKSHVVHIFNEIGCERPDPGSSLGRPPEIDLMAILNNLAHKEMRLC